MCSSYQAEIVNSLFVKVLILRKDLSEILYFSKNLLLFLRKLIALHWLVTTKKR